MRSLLLSLTIVVALVYVGNAQGTGTVTIDFGGTPLTISVTTLQRARLQRVLDQVNVQRLAAGQPAQTLEQRVRGRVMDFLRDEYNEGAAMEQTLACTNYEALNNAGQNTIKTALGGFSPCR
jgi:hypothetical protein